MPLSVALIDGKQERRGNSVLTTGSCANVSDTTLENIESPNVETNGVSDVDARSALSLHLVKTFFGLEPLLDSGCSIFMVGEDMVANYRADRTFDLNTGPRIEMADGSIQRPLSVGRVLMDDIWIRSYDMHHVFSQTLISVSQLDLMGFTIIFRNGFGCIWKNENVTIMPHSDPVSTAILKESNIYERTTNVPFDEIRYAYCSDVDAARRLGKEGNLDANSAQEEVIPDGWHSIDNANDPTTLSAGADDLEEVFLLKATNVVTDMDSFAKSSKSPMGRYSKVIKRMQALHACETTKLWHSRYGHFSKQMMDLLRKSGAVDGIALGRTIKGLADCSTCGSNARRKSFRRSSYRALRNGEMIHVDYVGHITKSREGYQYILVITDDRTRRISAYRCKSKKADEWLPILQEYVAWSNNQTGNTVKTIRTDGQFKTNDFDLWIKEKGIRVQYSQEYQAEENSRAERSNQRIIRVMRAIFLESPNIPTYLWPEVLDAAVYIANRMLNTAVSMTQVPEGLWTAQTPNVSNLRVIGCRVWARHPDKKVAQKHKDRAKFEPLGEECVLLGFDQMMRGWRLWSIKGQRIIVRTSCRFNEMERPSLNGRHIYTTSGKEDFDGNTIFTVNGKEKISPHNLDTLQKMFKIDNYRYDLLPGQSMEYGAMEDLSDAGSVESDDLTNDDSPIEQKQTGRRKGNLNGVSDDKKVLERSKLMGTDDSLESSRSDGIDLGLLELNMPNLLPTKARRNKDSSDDDDSESEDTSSDHELSDNSDSSLSSNGASSSSGDVSDLESDDSNNSISTPSQSDNGSVSDDTSSDDGKWKFRLRYKGSVGPVSSDDGYSDNDSLMSDDISSDDEDMKIRLRLLVEDRNAERKDLGSHNGTVDDGIDHFNGYEFCNADDNESPDTDVDGGDVDTGASGLRSGGFWNRDAKAVISAKIAELTNVYECTQIHSKVTIPLSRKQARNSKYWPEWLAAERREIASLKEMDTFQEMKRSEVPGRRRPIGGKWVYSLKDPTVVAAGGFMFKARYVAQGFTQELGKDYDETYAPVVKTKSIRIMLALAAHYGMPVHQMDVKSAYLYADLDKELYVEPPLQNEETKQSRKASGNDAVWKLNKCLYGLRQSGAKWNENIKSTLTTKMGFVQMASDACLYMRVKGIKVTIIGLYVDDLLIASTDLEELARTKNLMHRNYKMKDLGLCEMVLGIRVQQSKDGIRIDQTHYVEEMISLLFPNGLNSVKTPGFTGEMRSLDTPLTAQEEKSMSRPEVKYREAVGKLMYAMICTRPDICHAVSVVSTYCSRPAPENWEAVTRIFRYLQGAKDMGIMYKRGSVDAKYGDLELIVQGYSDASWSSPRSVSGLVYILADGPITWRARKQKASAQSAMESEYMALCEAAKEAAWLRRVLKELLCTQEKPTVIWEDNQSAIIFADHDGKHDRTKHIALRYHYTRDQIKAGEIEIKWLSTYDMLADIFTKPLARPTFERLRDRMMISCR